MADKLEIANAALAELRLEPVTLDEIEARDTITTRMLADSFATVRDEVLRKHPWNFAIKRVVLGEDEEADAPAWGYAHAFNLPCDFLRLVNTSQPYCPYRIEGNTVVSDSAEVELEYVAQITDTCLWDSIFTSAFIFRLAAKLAKAIHGQETMAATLMATYEAYLEEARTVDAQELQQPDQDLQGYSWIHARQGGHF